MPSDAQRRHAALSHKPPLTAVPTRLEDAHITRELSASGLTRFRRTHPPMPRRANAPTAMARALARGLLYVLAARRLPAPSKGRSGNAALAVAVGTIALALSLPTAAQRAADAYPVKTLRLLHGFTSGGAVDLQARLIGQQLSQSLGQQVLVDGRPGAGGTIGATIVARSAPDGYTLFLMASGHAAAPGLYRSLPYDATRDFTLISMVGSSPFVVLANPNAPVKTIQDLVARAKAEPGRINYGTGGIGSGMHLAAVLFQARTGTQINHVPYKGGTAGPAALLAGEIPVLFTTPGGSTQFIKDGRLRAIAVTTQQRFSLWPDVPTIAETVLPGFDVQAWYALAGPRNLPAPIVTRLNGIAREALAKSEVREPMLALGAEPRPSTAAEAQAFVASEVARWTKIVRAEGIPPQD
jgi:tripartite-type tricarboxylate transporter receptor subunit TctC